MSEKLLSTSESKRNLVAKAYLLLNEKLYDHAIKIFQDLLSMDPNDPEVLTGLSAVYMRKDQTKKALELAYQALNKDPSFYYAYDILAEIYFINKKDAFKAEEYAHKSLELNPYDSSTYSLLSQIYYFQKKYEECYVYASQALQIDPENYVAHMALGLYYAHIPNYDKVEEHFKICLSIAPNSSIVYGHFGLLNLAFSKNEVGYKLLREALRLNPTDKFLQENFREAFIRNNPFYAPLYYLSSGLFDDVYIIYIALLGITILGFFAQYNHWPKIINFLIFLAIILGIVVMLFIVIYRFIMRFSVNTFYNWAIKKGVLVKYL